MAVLSTEMSSASSVLTSVTKAPLQLTCLSAVHSARGDRSCTNVLPQLTARSCLQLESGLKSETYFA